MEMLHTVNVQKKFYIDTADVRCDSEAHGESFTSAMHRQQKISNTSDSTENQTTHFPLQVVIYAEDLPEDMQFHPTTEAIVYKYSLSDPTSPVVVAPSLRRKVFMLLKNVMVAEVTEIGLEKFGIQDGVVDGGDEVEDKTTKRRSGTRVRYGLTASIEGIGESFFKQLSDNLLLHRSVNCATSYFREGERPSRGQN